MKRSKSIRLVLLGGLSAGALAGCGPNAHAPAPISENNVYTNNYYVPGVGYYHAPFRNWYELPYNHFDATARLYFFGGQWAGQPHQSITNISSPTEVAASHAQAVRTDIPPSSVRRGGWGYTSHGGYGIHA